MFTLVFDVLHRLLQNIVIAEKKPHHLLADFDPSEPDVIEQGFEGVAEVGDILKAEQARDSLYGMNGTEKRVDAIWLDPRRTGFLNLYQESLRFLNELLCLCNKVFLGRFHGLSALTITS